MHLALYHQQNKCVIKSSILKKKILSNPTSTHFSIPLSQQNGRKELAIPVFQTESSLSFSITFPSAESPATSAWPNLCSVFHYPLSTSQKHLPTVSDAIFTLVYFTSSLDLLSFLSFARSFFLSAPNTTMSDLESLLFFKYVSSQVILSLNISTTPYHKHHWMVTAPSHQYSTPGLMCLSLCTI